MPAVKKPKPNRIQKPVKPAETPDQKKNVVSGQVSLQQQAMVSLTVNDSIVI